MGYYSHPTNNLRRLGLALFAIGIIIFLAKTYVMWYVSLLISFVSGGIGNYVSEAYLWTHFMSFALVIAGVIVFYIGRKQKDMRPQSNAVNDNA